MKTLKKLLTLITLLSLHPCSINTTHEDYNSPEGAEEQYIETLQNHADDENIYSFGLIGQENEDLVELTKFHLSKIPNLLQIGNLINRLINKKNGDVIIEVNSEEESEEGFDEELKEKKRVYNNSRKVYSKIFRYLLEIKNEVEMVFERLDYLEISTEDLLVFFDFEEYYESVVRDINKENPGFYKFKRELDLIVFEFSTSMKDFFEAIRAFFNFDRFIIPFFEPYKEEFLAEDPENVVFKVDKGVKMVNQILQAKNFLDMFCGNILKGVSQVRSIRNDVLYAISKFKEIEEFEFNLGKKRILENSGFWKISFSFFILTTFF